MRLSLEAVNRVQGQHCVAYNRGGMHDVSYNVALYAALTSGLLLCGLSIFREFDVRLPPPPRPVGATRCHGGPARAEARKHWRCVR